MWHKAQKKIRCPEEQPEGTQTDREHISRSTACGTAVTLVAASPLTTHSVSGDSQVATIKHQITRSTSVTRLVQEQQHSKNYLHKRQRISQAPEQLICNNRGPRRGCTTGFSISSCSTQGAAHAGSRSGCTTNCDRQLPAHISDELSNSVGSGDHAGPQLPPRQELSIQ